MRNKPLISACLLSYNLDNFIEKVIVSIIMQSISDFEFIISDDCSTDKSWEIIKVYADNHNFIKAIRHNKNIGMAKNANFCFSISEGKYIALLSHDDIPDKYLFEKWLKVIEKDENISFVFNDYLNNGVASHKNEKRNFNEIMNGNDFLKSHLLRHWGSPIRIGAFIRKSCLNEIGGMDEKFKLLADIDLWMRLSAKWKVGYVAEPLIEVNRVWKEGYPEEYTGFSWRKMLLLFDIHATHLKRLYGNNFYKWIFFRAKVSYEIIKWLTYGVLRKKNFIIKKADEAKCKYEYPIVKIYRYLLKKLYVE